MRGQRLELVGRGGEGQAGDRRDLFGDQLGEADRRVEPGADRGAALRQLIEPGSVELDALIRFDLRGVAGEFLAERQRRRVLGVGAADLDDVGEGFGLSSSARADASAPAAAVRDLLGAAMCMAVG
jgi:hypothetical protein